MKDLFIVAKFTFLDTVKRKSFIISNLIMLVLIVIAINIPNIIEAINDGDDSGDKILIVDKDNIYSDSLNVLNNMELGYEFTVETKEISFDEIKKKIEDEEIDNAFTVSLDNEKLNINYYVKNKAILEYEPTDLINVLTELYKNVQLSKLDLTEEELKSINPEINFQVLQTEETEVKGNILVIMMISLLLFYIIYICAYQVSTSITTEKTSKIIETLVTSTTPKNIVIGKTIGVGFTGVLELIAIIATALLSIKYCLEPEVIEQFVDLSTFTPLLGIITIAYFILGYLFYAFLFALTGSTVSKPEDVQSANLPIVVILMVGFYLSYFTMMNPTAEIGHIAGLIPLSSPFCMPFRVMMDVSSTSEILLSLAIIIITSLIIASVSIRIYSQAILNTGSRLSLKEIIEMYKNKNI